MIRSADLYDQNPDIHTTTVHRWVRSGYLRPVRRVWGSDRLGHFLPDWTPRMVRLLVQIGANGGLSTDPNRRVISDHLRRVAVFMDAGLTQDWFVSLEGAPVIPVARAEDVATMVAGTCWSTVLAVPDAD